MTIKGSFTFSWMGYSAWRNLICFINAIVVLAIMVAILLFASMAQVDAGHVAVLTLFGRVQGGETLGEGIHFVNPFSVKHELTVRTQEQKETAAVPSSEGLIMTLEASLLFHLDPDRATAVPVAMRTAPALRLCCGNQQRTSD